MSTVAIDISEEMYAYFENLAQTYDIPVSRLVDQALRRVKLQREIRENRQRIASSTHSVLDHEPISVGKVLKPLGPRAEWIDEFLDRGDTDDRH